MRVCLWVRAFSSLECSEKCCEKQETKSDVTTHPLQTHAYAHSDSVIPLNLSDNDVVQTKALVTYMGIFHKLDSVVRSDGGAEWGM